jgi:hypothetical protein
MAMLRGNLARSLGSKAVRDLASVEERPSAVSLSAVGGIAATPCGVCTQQLAKYTCPRCFARYCSAACYREHGRRCTEGFFKEQVLDATENARLGCEQELTVAHLPRR